MKIQIIGYSGSGKSTLAIKLGKLFNIPVLHLDVTKFYGDWQERTVEEQNKIVQEFLDKNENWVIDGNYTKICPQRFEESDMTIYLNFNRLFCFFSAYRRYKKYRHKHRESLPCNDKFDKTFRNWLLFSGRTKERAIKNLENLNKTKGQKYIFKNRRQVNKFVQKLENEIKQK